MASVSLYFSRTSQTVGFIFSCNFLQFPGSVWYTDVLENYFHVKSHSFRQHILVIPKHPFKNAEDIFVITWFMLVSIISGSKCAT